VTDDPSREQLLTTDEVATVFRVDPKTVVRWVKDGRIEATRTPGGHLRFRAVTVSQFINAGAAPAL
jgi:excisionase family DNA binding protein